MLSPSLGPKVKQLEMQDMVLSHGINTFSFFVVVSIFIRRNILFPAHYLKMKEHALSVLDACCFVQGFCFCFHTNFLLLFSFFLSFFLSFLFFFCSRVEADSLQHLSARYCPLMPPPRSTIAAAFSPDGKTLASTQ